MRKYKVRRKEEEWQSRLGTSTFNPLEVMDLQDAIKSKQEEVSVQDKKFLLIYKGATVYYKPKHGFVPCGHLRIESFLREI